MADRQKADTLFLAEHRSFELPHKGTRCRNDPSAGKREPRIRNPVLEKAVSHP